MKNDQGLIHVDFASIPEHIQDSLAKATMELLKDIESTPEGRLALERKKEEIARKRDNI